MWFHNAMTLSTNFTLQEEFNAHQSFLFDADLLNYRHEQITLGAGHKVDDVSDELRLVT